MPDPVDLGSAAPWPAPFSDTFVEQARALLDRTGVLVIIAPVGASRQRLASSIAGAPEGQVWFRHIARYGEKDRRYFALQQFFPELPISADDDPEHVELALHNALAQFEAEMPPLVLANTDLCDPESVELLVAAATAEHLRLIATLTPETAVDQALLLTSGEILDIPPLDERRIAILLEARFGIRPHPMLVTQLAERTDGSYAALRDIADASATAGQILVVEDHLVPDPDSSAADHVGGWLTSHSSDRLGGGDDITALLQVTALLGRIDDAEARACVPADVVDLATKHGALTLTGDTLTLTSRAEELVVLRTLSEQRRTELFELFAHRLPRSILLPGVSTRAADWWITAGRPIPVDLAARAGREANLKGHPRRAIVYTDPRSNVDQAVVAPTERLLALLELGDDTSVEELVAAIDPVQLSDDELLVYLQWAVAADREELVEQAADAEDPADRRRRALIGTLAVLIYRSFDSGSDEHVTRLRSLAFSLQLSPCNRATAFAALSGVLRLAGRAEQAVEAAEFALRILAEEPDTVSVFHTDLAHAMHVTALISALDLDGAQRAVNTYPSPLGVQRASGHPTKAIEAYISMLRGDAQAALATARLCLSGMSPHDPDQIRGWLEAMVAQILVQCDRTDEAYDLVRLAEGHPSSRLETDMARRIALASVQDSFAEPEEALNQLVEINDTARGHGLLMVQISAAMLSVQIGGPPHLPMLLDVVDDLVEPSGVPQACQAFARAVQRYDLSSLIELAEHLAERRALQFASEVAQYVLDMARRATDLDDQTRARLTELAEAPSPSRTSQAG